jgi:hypothetical protein
MLPFLFRSPVGRISVCRHPAILIVLIDIFVQPALEAHQWNTAITLVGWLYRIARQILHEGHALPAGGGDEACEVVNPCSEPVFAETLPSTPA